MKQCSRSWVAAAVAAAHGARRRTVMLVSVVAIGATVGCSKLDRSLPPAPYVAPPVGTVYRYAGFSNRILASDGWRVRFADDSGRQGARVALFISDDPQHPSVVDSAQLAELWPLTDGKQTTVRVRSGATTWRWMFKVVGVQQVTVPAGTFETYVVQAVQRPDSAIDPQRSTVVGYTWHYAPAIGAVARFKTTYFSGSAKGRIVESALERVDAPAAATGR